MAKLRYVFDLFLLLVVNHISLVYCDDIQSIDVGKMTTEQVNPDNDTFSQQPNSVNDTNTLSENQKDISRRNAANPVSL